MYFFICSRWRLRPPSHSMYVETLFHIWIFKITTHSFGSVVKIQDQRLYSFFSFSKNISKTTKEFHFAFCRSVCVVAEEEVSASMASVAAEAFAFVTLVINTLMKRSKWMETRPLETLLLRPHQLLEEGGYHNFGLSVGDDPWGASFFVLISSAFKLIGG